jgi:hypothetical protein
MAGVKEQIYRGSGEVSPAAALPQSSPQAFGAGIGDAVAGAGSEVYGAAMRAQEVERNRQRNAETSQAGVDFANATSDASIWINQAREQAPPGAPGYTDAVRKELKARADAFLETIKDPRVRERYAPEVASWQGRLLEEEDGWARGRRIEHIGKNFRDATNSWANQLTVTGNEDVLATALKERETTVGGLGVGEAISGPLLEEARRGLVSSYYEGKIEQDPASAVALLTAKENPVNAYLKADDLRRLKDRADTEVRVRLADANRIRSQAEAQVREDVGEYKQRIDRGELPSDEETTKLATRAQTLGLTNLVDDIGYSSGKLKMSRLTDKWTSAEWEQNINGLAAKVAQNKASAEEQQELRILQELRPAKEARFKGDPDGYAAASGMPPPQVDLANPDPGTIQARKSWAKSFARTGGLVEPPYLSKDQLQVYRDRASQGAVGQLEVAAELRNTWGLDAAPSIVRQIGGEAKGQMLVMLGLNDRMAQVYRRGNEALDKKAVKLDDKIISQTWQQYLPGVPADVAPALLDTARKITAGWMLEQGKTEPTADFGQVFRQALHRAGGMLGSANEGSATGGFVNWNGRFAWLPTDMARSDFQGRLSRALGADWIRAAVDASGNPTNAVPHHLGPDGRLKPYTKGEALRFGRGSLVTVAPGIYRLVDPAGGTVVDQNGSPWQFDVRRLPRGHFGGAR